jgi:hypothetical protein
VIYLDTSVVLAYLASIEFLRVRRQTVELASYDERLLAGARALHIPLYAS